MSRSYNKLWHILIDKGMSKTQLREAAGITTNALANLGKNESVPVETLEKICSVLHCTIDDIMQFQSDAEITDEGHRSSPHRKVEIREGASTHE